MQSNMMNGTMTRGGGAQLSEQDLFHSIIVLLKHTAREYTTAVTESSCAVVRQTMQRLLHETLTEQADCFSVMNRQGWYPPAPDARRQDVQNSIQTNQQCAQKTSQFLSASGIRPTRSGTGQPSGGWQNPMSMPQWQTSQPQGMMNPQQGMSRGQAQTWPAPNYQGQSQQPQYTNTVGGEGQTFSATADTYASRARAQSTMAHPELS